MTRTERRELGARARQVLDVIYRLGEASAADIQREIPDLPSYSAVRSILRALEDKGLIRHREAGMRYVFSPTVPKRTAVTSAFQHLLATFFDGSPERAMQALLEVTRDQDVPVDYDALARMIDEAREEGR